MSNYRTIFTGTLVQDSALSTGGNEGNGGMTDSPLCRDGKGRYTLRGTTLAGALIATAGKLYGEEKLIQTEITGPRNGSEESLRPSRWRIFSSHPQNCPNSEERQGVGILQATGAAADGALFDVETLPKNARWPFCLEVNVLNAGDKNPEEIAAAALLEWQRGRCWIGRDVARGLGWLHLEELKAYRLSTEQAELWPDSSKSLQEVLEDVKKTAAVVPVSADDFAKAFGPFDLKTDWHYVEISGHIRAGEREDGYGLDAVSVSGHVANLQITEWDEAHYLKPEGKSEKAQADDFAPDSSIVLTCNSDGRLVPFIPGSGLRGTLRHALSRLLRAQNKSIADPLEPSEKEDEAARLFGSMKKSAALLVRDAYLTDSEKWRAAWLQHHAEDEFSGGVYGSGKFDRVVLVDAEFEWKMVIEAKTRKEAEEYQKCLGLVLDLAKKGFLPVGGNQWRGVGWPRWIIENPGRISKAGENAK
ncbi:MAG: hypothetical protein GY862_15060 [Gammaproteobacteria bacterium]|nr:hypothetical protein [Gammaproteobacteria bacterium]